MTLPCRFTPASERDLEDIALYIAIDSPRRALSFVADLRAHCHKIALQPEAYVLLDRHPGEQRILLEHHATIRAWACYGSSVYRDVARARQREAGHRIE